MSEGNGGNGRIDTEALLARTDIVQVVGHYRALTKAGTEYKAQCLWHAPDNHPSLCVVPGKQFVWCGACGAHGNAIDVVMQATGAGFREACEVLGNGHVWTPAAPVSDPAGAAAAKRRNPGPRTVGTPPQDGPVPAMSLRELGTPTEVRAIRSVDGALLGYECRYPRGEDGKSPSRVWTWGRVGNGSGVWKWGCGVFPVPRPLYGLDRLAGRAADRVCITEGPKKADAAMALLPGYVCLSWTGGHQSWKYHDWALLSGRTVLLWPDSDNLNDRGQRVGWDSMLRCGEMLALMRCNVWIIEVEERNGWDAADALAEGWDWPRVREWIRPRMRQVRAVEPEEAAMQEPIEPVEPEAAPAAVEPLVKPPRAPRRSKPDLGVVDGNAVRAPRPATDSDGEPLPVALSDGALANFWLDSYGADWRYVEVWDQWFQWAGDVWQEDRTSRVKSLALRVCQAAAHFPEARELTADAKRKLSGIPKAGNVLSAMRIHESVVAIPEQWDCDPWLLGVPGGMVDLRTGELMEGRRQDYIRKCCAVAPADPEAREMPATDAFLRRVQPDPEVRAYLQRLIGYGLTGITREQIFSFWQGGGGNGKGTLLRAVMGMMGQYAVNADISTFTERPVQAHSQELARLDGARLVVAEETDSNMKWAEGRIKKITGEGNLTARRMRENDYEFAPRFLLIFVGQHIPDLSRVNAAMKRRLHLVPWSVRVEGADVDMELDAKLQAEWPSLLRWAINGCLEWQRGGLRPPRAVLAAGADYFEDQDYLSQFMDCCLEVEPSSKLGYGALITAYQAWAKVNSQPSLSQRALIEAIAQAGFERVKSHGDRYLKGLRLRPFEERVPDAPVARGRDWD